MNIPRPCKLCGEPKHRRHCPICGAPVTCAEVFPRRAHGKCRWWEPNPGPQTEFLSTPAFDVLYGGAAGGGKTAALAAMPLRWIDHPDLNFIGFRRESTQLKNLLKEARNIYRIAEPDARRNRTENSWTFPSDAFGRFTHLQHEGDEDAHDGQEYQVVLWDELTHFTERQYRALLSRIRSSSGDLPGISRATTNPGGTGGEWVFRRWGPWLDPDWAPDHKYEPVHGDGRPLVARFDATGRKLPPALPGEILYFIDVEGGCQFVPRGSRDCDGIEAASRQFIPAKLSDNPILLKGSPSYRQKLRVLDPLRRAQLLDGNWLIRAAAGLLFKRVWCQIVDMAPVEGVRVRFWDRASTVPEKGKDPDWTVGVKYHFDRRGTYTVEHVIRMQGTPRQVEDVIVETALADNADDHNRCSLVLAKDPGQAGVSDVDHYISHPKLQTIDVRAEPESGDKVTRFLPVSAQCEGGNVKVVRGPWNQRFFDELEGFPDLPHDDDADALSGAHNWMAANAPSRILKPSRASESQPRGY